MIARIVSLFIGYFCGCFLTAEVVAYKVSGKSAAELGDTGNPGMANIMASLGFLPGLITLAGDLGKCILAAELSFLLFHGIGWIVVLYAGLGCTLGHDFPFWRRFEGGKGVATTSMAVGIYKFVPGLASNIIGMLIVFLTKYLCVGGPVIPMSYMVFMAIAHDWEAVGIAAVLTLLSFKAHCPQLLGIRNSRTKKTDVLLLIRRKLSKKNDE